MKKCLGCGREIETDTLKLVLPGDDDVTSLELRLCESCEQILRKRLSDADLRIFEKKLADMRRGEDENFGKS